MAAFTTVTVATGKEIHVNVGGMGLTKYTAGQTVKIQTQDAVRFKAAGLVTY